MARSLAIALMLLTGCLAEPGSVVGPGGGPGADGVAPPLPQASNDGLSMNGLSQNRLSLNRLSLNALSKDRLLLDGAGLEATPEGRELLTYVVRCALPESERLSVVINDIAYSFPGLLGLAPEWLDGECDESCQRWVSACLMAHVNALGVSVPISVRAPGTAITSSDDELAMYGVQEGAFWGDIFVDEGETPEMYVCTGRTPLTTQLEDDPDSWLSKRLCAAWGDEAACGFVNIGPCEDINWVHMQRACQIEEDAEGGFTSCISSDRPDAAKFDQVVTIYLPGEEDRHR